MTEMTEVKEGTEVTEIREVTKLHSLDGMEIRGDVKDDEDEVEEELEEKKEFDEAVHEEVNEQKIEKVIEKNDSSLLKSEIQIRNLSRDHHDTSTESARDEHAQGKLGIVDNWVENIENDTLSSSSEVLSFPS